MAASGPWLRVPGWLQGRLSAVLGIDANVQLLGQIVRGLVGTAGLRVVALGLTFVTTGILARLLGPGDFGVYALVLATINLLSVPTELGLSSLVVREVAKYRVRGEWGFIRGLILRANQIALGMSLISMAGVIVWLWTRRTYGLSKYEAVFHVAVLLIPVVALSRVRSGVLQGLGHVLAGQVPDSLLRPGVFVFLVGMAAISGGLTPWSAMALNVVSAMLALVVGAWLLIKCLPRNERQSGLKYETSAWIRSLLPLSVLTGLGVINAQTDIFILGLYRSSVEVGVYRSASLVALQIPILTTLMELVLAPVISSLFHGGAMDRLWRLARQSVLVAIVVSIPLAAACIFFGKWLLVLFFGQPYGAAASALAILAFGQLFSVSVGSVGLFLKMTGHEMSAAYAGAIAMALNVALNFVFVPWLGMEGAAVATTASVAVANVLMLLTAKRRLGIWMSPFLRQATASSAS